MESRTAWYICPNCRQEVKGDTHYCTGTYFVNSLTDTQRIANALERIASALEKLVEGK